MPELIVPTVRLHAAWIEARNEWGAGVDQDGSGLEPSALSSRTGGSWRTSGRADSHKDG